MAKINKHGLKMIGLKKVAGETKKLNYDNTKYLQLNYDKKDGEVWTDYFWSIGQNSWNEYNSPNIITIANLSEPHTMQEIADLIAERLAIC